MSDKSYPRFQVVFGGGDAFREPMTVEAADFIAVKGYKAKGKRLTTYQLQEVNELEPTRFDPEPEPEADEPASPADGQLSILDD